MNIACDPPPFGTNTQLQNEFHLQPSLFFAGNFHWTGNVTLNRDKTMAKGGRQPPGPG